MMPKLKSNILTETIFQIELSRLTFLTKEFLENLLTHNPIFGKKGEKYHILNCNRIINNFQQTQEVEYFNMFLQACLRKGFSLTMIKL